MSPEQARGGSVDRRADIWAFGVILYEMLTGQKLFQGETVSDTLAAVLRAEPDWSALPADEAPVLCRLVERCLDRDPKQRLRDIGEARVILQGGDPSATLLDFSLPGSAAHEVGSAPRKANLPLTLALVLGSLAVGAFLGWQVLAGQEPAPVLHTMLPPPAEADYDLTGSAPGPAAISPDGSMVAFTAQDPEGVTRLYLRHLDKGESVSLSGTEGAAYPFWSPDNRFIGYFEPDGEKLRKIAVAGGPPVTICPAQNGKGGSWNERGEIIFAPGHDTSIHKVPAIGGEPVALTAIGPEHDSHRHPRFLPGGREFIFIGRHQVSDRVNDVMIASLDTAVAVRAVAESMGNADYVQGHLLTVREGVLMATPYTSDQPRAIEGGMPLVENVLVIPGASVAVFSPSKDGMLIYQTGASAESGKMLYWADIENGGMQALGESGQVFHPIISPDGTQAVVEVREASNEGTDLWLVDLESGLRTRFTFAPGDEVRPVWSPGGRYLYYESRAEGRYGIVRQPVEGQGVGTTIMEADHEIAPTSVALGDRDILIDFERDDGKFDMRRLVLDDEAAEPVVIGSASAENLGGGIYSPDGRWIAYHSESAAGWDVFVMSATGGDRKWQITTDGSVYPRWSHDGRELWVCRFSGALRVYDVDGSGETFQSGAFREPLEITSPDATGNYYDLHPDGRRILQSGIDPAFRAEVSYLHLVTDWQRGLVQ
jgi:Tol biopolymer transport system component